MHSPSRGAGRSLFVAVLATAVPICAASSVTAPPAAAAAPAPARAARFAHPRPHAPPSPAELQARTLAARERHLARQVVAAALRERGVRYSYGGESPDVGFDCSGLVAWSFAQIGLRLPHSSYELATLGRAVSLDHLHPGDVLVFHGRGHVGIYVGHHLFVHAPHSGTTVTVESLSGTYAVGAGLELARRLLPL